MAFVTLNINADPGSIPLAQGRRAKKRDATFTSHLAECCTPKLQIEAIPGRGTAGAPVSNVSNISVLHT
jgi:hypothetical protein